MDNLENCKLYEVLATVKQASTKKVKKALLENLDPDLALALRNVGIGGAIGAGAGGLAGLINEHGKDTEKKDYLGNILRKGLFGGMMGAAGGGLISAAPHIVPPMGTPKEVDTDVVGQSADAIIGTGKELADRTGKAIGKVLEEPVKTVSDNLSTVGNVVDTAGPPVATTAAVYGGSKALSSAVPRHSGAGGQGFYEPLSSASTEAGQTLRERLKLLGMTDDVADTIAKQYLDKQNINVLAKSNVGRDIKEYVRQVLTGQPVKPEGAAPKPVAKPKVNAGPSPITTKYDSFFDAKPGVQGTAKPAPTPKAPGLANKIKEYLKQQAAGKGLRPDFTATALKDSVIRDVVAKNKPGLSGPALENVIRETQRSLRASEVGLQKANPRLSGSRTAKVVKSTPAVLGLGWLLERLLSAKGNTTNPTLK